MFASNFVFVSTKRTRNSFSGREEKEKSQKNVVLLFLFRRSPSLSGALGGHKTEEETRKDNGEKRKK